MSQGPLSLHALRMGPVLSGQQSLGNSTASQGGEIIIGVWGLTEPASKTHYFLSALSNNFLWLKLQHVLRLRLSSYYGATQGMLVTSVPT